MVWRSWKLSTPVLLEPVGRRPTRRLVAQFQRNGDDEMYIGSHEEMLLVTQDFSERHVLAEIEHDSNKDKDARSAAIEDVKWTGVSVFRLAAAVEPKVVRTGKGRVTGTCYSKLDAQPHHRMWTRWHQPKTGKLVFGC